MRYHATQLDHVRWRSETLDAEISAPPTMGTFLEFQGRDTALFGWRSTDDQRGESLSIELDRSEAQALYDLLGERLAVRNTP